MSLHSVTKYMSTTSGLSVLIHGIMSLPDAMSCDKMGFSQCLIRMWCLLCML